MANLEELSLDADASPRGVILHHPQDQSDHLFVETGPTGPTESSERRPFPPYEFPMPPKHRFRPHQHRTQRGTAHESAQRSHDRSICRLESRSFDLTANHAKLIAEKE